jgi:Zn-dependent protease
MGKVGGGVVAAGGLAKLAGKAFLVAKGFGVLLKFKTAGSMLISVAAYALFWGWRFAVGFVALMFVHEVGHVVVLRAQGVKASAPMFIPFLGAFVKLEQGQRSVVEEALSALAGPVFGLVGAGAVYLAGQATGSPLLTALAYTGFLLNLFNLMPMLPLDGGRVAGAIHPYLWLGGAAVAVGFLIFHPSPVVVFVLVLGGIELVTRWRERRSGKVNPYYAVAPATRWQLAGAYVAVAVLCLLGMQAAYVPASL